MDTIASCYGGIGAPASSVWKSTALPRRVDAARIADWRRHLRRTVLCAMVLTLAVTPEMTSAQARQTAPSVTKIAHMDNAAANRAWWKKCTVIRDEHARLACFDASVPSDADNAVSHASPSRDTMTPSSSASAQSVASPAQPQPEPQLDARTVTYRVAAGYGSGIGGHAGSFEVSGGTLHTQAGFGSEGDTFLLQLWVDDWIAEDWSSGFEYMYVNNVGKLDLFLPNGASVLTDPITAHAYADVHGHFGFVNFAYRPQATSVLRPYIGLGLGAGWGSAHTDLAAQNAFVGYYHYESKGSSVVGAMQGFLGIDARLYESSYVSVFGKAIWVPGHPFRVDQRYVDFVFGAAIGQKF